MNFCGKKLAKKLIRKQTKKLDEETNKCTFNYIRCLLITTTCFGRFLQPSSGCTVLKSTIKSESVRDISL